MYGCQENWTTFSRMQEEIRQHAKYKDFTMLLDWVCPNYNTNMASDVISNHIISKSNILVEAALTLVFVLHHLLLSSDQIQEVRWLYPSKDWTLPSYILDLDDFFTTSHILFPRSVQYFWFSNLHWLCCSSLYISRVLPASLYWIREWRDSIRRWVYDALLSPRRW